MIDVPRSSLTVPGTPTRFLVVGDSLSAINGPNGSFTGYLAPMLAAAALAVLGVVPFLPGGSRRTSFRPTSPHVWNNIAKSGSDCLQMISDGIPAQIVAYKPDVLVWACFGRNDVVGRIASGVPSRATCAANHLSILQTSLTALPNLQALVTSPVCEGELHPDGSNANDTEMDAQDVIQANAAALAGARVTYVSLRGPFFTEEAIVNPQNQPTGVLSSDGVHLFSNTTPPAAGGQQWAAQQLYPYFRFS